MLTIANRQKAAAAAEERARRELEEATLAKNSPVAVEEPKKIASGELYDSLFDNVWQNTAESVPEIDPQVSKANSAAEPVGTSNMLPSERCKPKILFV